MRTNGHVMGALATVATLRSVIFSSEGFDLVFVFCGSASSTSSGQNDPAPSAAAPLRKFLRAKPRDDLPIELPLGCELFTKSFSTLQMLALISLVLALQSWIMRAGI